MVSKKEWITSPIPTDVPLCQTASKHGARSIIWSHDDKRVSIVYSDETWTVNDARAAAEMLTGMKIEGSLTAIRNSLGIVNRRGDSQKIS